jgi:hypothetical protein
MPLQRRYRIFRDAGGTEVRLSWARWRHIQKRHPEISEHAIREAIAKPVETTLGPDCIYYRWRIERRAVCVVVRDARGLYVRTAYSEERPVKHP